METAFERIRDSPKDAGSPTPDMLVPNKSSKPDEMTTKQIIMKFIVHNKHLWILCVASFFHYFIRTAIMEVRHVISNLFFLFP
jgi:sugar phosphate permease